MGFWLHFSDKFQSYCAIKRQPGVLFLGSNLLSSEPAFSPRSCRVSSVQGMRKRDTAVVELYSASEGSTLHERGLSDGLKLKRFEPNDYILK